MDVIRRTKVTLMLADHAQTADGKLNVLGGGWTITGPHPVPFALVALVEMPWDAAGEPHTVRFELIDDQGAPVLVPTDDSDQPLVIEATFDLAPSPGVKRGTPLTMPIAMNLSPPPPIPAGGRYEWRVEVDGETHEEWRIGFSTRHDPEAGAP
ncbi:MAG: hypothetical protein QOI98_2117 [Solirubrobacteraceae bacterium]|jgi:hypothetical protein|nr:hypothetical protein [Solirubrobacteraceae bacterium]